MFKKKRLSKLIKIKRKIVIDKNPNNDSNKKPILDSYLMKTLLGYGFIINITKYKKKRSYIKN